MILSAIETEELAGYTERYPFAEYIRNKNFLITGSNGMTATGIIKWLLYENAVHNTACHIYASTRHPERKPGYLEAKDNVAFCRFGAEKEAVGTDGIDYVIHAAAPTGRKFFMSRPVETLRVIVDGTERMLELAQEKKAAMVFLSSVEAYGVPDVAEPLTEAYVGAVDSLNIRSGYPLGKKAAEFLCYAMSKEYGTDVKIVRLSTVQGLLQPYEEQRIFNELLRCVLENKNLIMRSDGLSKKSIVYTLDAISGIFAVLFKGKSGEAYNITDPSTYLTMNELADYVFKMFRPELKIVYDIQEAGKTGYLPHLSFTQDITKIRQLGWEPLSNLKHIYEVDVKRFGGRS